MIPKVIHYCWFGGKELPELEKKCVGSWKEKCGDYKIIEWNETNYNFNDNIYVNEAYEAKKWAFVSDYVRLDVIYKYGGIYLDTDVELLKNLDELLESSYFLATQELGIINTGLGFGAEKNNPNIKLMLDKYDNIHFKLGKNLYDLLPCTYRNTAPFIELGYKSINELQIINGGIIFPPEYFSPLDYETKKFNLTKNTISIHYYNASWISEEEKQLKRDLDEYMKTHNRISSFIYKNIREYKIQQKRYSFALIIEFVLNKFKKKIIRLIKSRF